MRRPLLMLLPLLLLAACSWPPAPKPAPPQPVVQAEPTAAPSPRAAGDGQSFEATAYSIEGTTKSGRPAKPGLVAADPKILPLGTRIRVDGAGQYSGVYTVADTGRTIKGREIDIYITSDAEAVRFGRRNVTVTVVDSVAEQNR